MVNCSAFKCQVVPSSDRTRHVGCRRHLRGFSAYHVQPSNRFPQCPMIDMDETNESSPSAQSEILDDLVSNKTINPYRQFDRTPVSVDLRLLAEESGGQPLLLQTTLRAISKNVDNSSPSPQHTRQHTQLHFCTTITLHFNTFTHAHQGIQSHQ